MSADLWLSIIALGLVVVSWPASAVFSYLVSRKTFEDRFAKEREVERSKALDVMLHMSKQYGSIVAAEAAKVLGADQAALIEARAGRSKSI